MSGHAGALCMLLLLSTEGARALVAQARFPVARCTPPNARAATPLLKLDVAPSASAAALIVAGALVVSAATSTTWPSATVRAGLASLTLLDLRPTAERQLAESQSALAAVEASDVASRKTWRRRAGPAAVKHWARLVRGKAAGELLGLSIAAIIAPCIGACVVLLSHLAFWRLGAAGARIDAAAEPAPLPLKLVRAIVTADAFVLSFAALGAFGHNAAARGTGAALFGTAALFVSAEAIPKARARRRTAAPAAPFRVEDLPPIGIKGRSSNTPQMSTTANPATATRAAVAIRAAASVSALRIRSTVATMSVTTGATVQAPDESDTSHSGPIETSERVWAEQWWPLGFAAHTSRTEPNAIQLLGTPLVVWWDDSEDGGGEANGGVGGGGDQTDSGVWRVTLDRCSHRLAPLSEGRVAKGCLECPYHGWSFDGAGQCVRVPQQEDGTTYNARRAAVMVLPCVERQGIIWAWAGALFEGALTSPPVGDDGPAMVAELEREGVAYTDYSRDLHMAMPLASNHHTVPYTSPHPCLTLTPSLLPLHRTGARCARTSWTRRTFHSHTTRCVGTPLTSHLNSYLTSAPPPSPLNPHPSLLSTQTISKRSKAGPISFDQLDNFDISGFSAARRTAAGQGRLTFSAPHLIIAETHRGADSYSDWNVVYAVPLEPGRCRLMVRVVFEVAKLPIPLKWILTYAFTKQPLWWTHLGTHKILEDDNIFLHAQGHTYRAGHATELAPDWNKRVYLPTASDGMVAAFHKWVQRYTAGEGAPWSPLGAGEVARALPARVSKAQVLERHESHVKHCAACSGALANIHRTHRFAEVAVVIGLLSAALKRARTAGLVLAAISFAATRVCAVLDAKMRIGIYPPPRNG